MQSCSLGVFQRVDEGQGHSVRALWKLAEVECVQCGQCVSRSPTGARAEKSEVDAVLQAVQDGRKVVFSVAPAVRAALAELFDKRAGHRLVKNEIVTALKTLGPNVYVLDANFAADLTVMEEAAELVERVGRKTQGGDLSNELPQFTSCCPA